MTEGPRLSLALTNLNAASAGPVSAWESTEDSFELPPQSTSKSGSSLLPARLSRFRMNLSRLAKCR